MTQEAVNNAKVLYRLSIDREDVEKAEKLYFLTPDLQNVMESPIVSYEKKCSVLEDVFKLENMPEKLVKFFKVMCRHQTISQIKDIFKAYYLYWDKMNNVVRAELICTSEPTKEQLDEANDILKREYPDSQIILTQSTDDTLLGGYVLRVLDKEYDKSIKERLYQLEKKLTGR